MRRCALVAAVVLSAAEAAAWCRTTTSPEQPDPTVCPSEGRPLAWPGTCAGFRLDPTVLPDPGQVPPARLGEALNRAARGWSLLACAPSGRPPSFSFSRLADAPTTFGYAPEGPNVNTVRFTTVWGRDAFHPPDAAAVTLVTFGPRSGDIVDADTELNLRAPSNPSGFEFSLDDERGGADLETIFAHELGHALGLAHSGARSAVMWYAAGRGERRREPTADDIAGACEVHPPGRAAVCDADRHRDLLLGGGARCGAAAGARRGSAGVLLAGLTALVIARRRR